MRYNLTYLVTNLFRKAAPVSCQTIGHFYICRLTGKVDDAIDHLSEISNGNSTAVDIGANRGLYTYPMRSVFDTVHAFEPIKEHVECLEHLGSSVNVHNVALSDEEGEAILHIPTKNGSYFTGWSSLEPGEQEIYATCEERSVKVSTLDSFNLEEVGLIKIDVEGHELTVLRGAESTIRRCKPHLLIEVWSKNRKEVSDFFEEVGYKKTTLTEVKSDNQYPAITMYVPRL